MACPAWHSCRRECVPAVDVVNLCSHQCGEQSQHAHHPCSASHPHLLPCTWSDRPAAIRANPLCQDGSAACWSVCILCRAVCCCADDRSGLWQLPSNNICGGGSVDCRDDLHGRVSFLKHAPCCPPHKNVYRLDAAAATHSAKHSMFMPGVFVLVLQGFCCGECLHLFSHPGGPG